MRNGRIKWKLANRTKEIGWSRKLSNWWKNWKFIEDVLPDWANEDVEKSPVEAVDKFQKEEEDKKKKTFF